MRFFIDMPLTPLLIDRLRVLGHDAVHASETGDATASDTAILLRARAENRVVITADLDFTRLMVETPARSPGIILLRGGSYSDLEMIDLVSRVIREVDPQLIFESLIVVDRYRIRRRRLPIA